MKNNLSCNTVRDLLPIYLDGIASEETNICVKKHLSECKLCLSEYKKLCEITEKNIDVINKDVTIVKRLKRRVLRWFITVIIFGIILVSLAMVCHYYNPKYYTRPTNFELISLLPLYIGVYILPLIATFVAVIWKKTISIKEKIFWPNVIISFLLIGVLGEVVLLLSNFLSIIKFISQ